MTNSLMTIDDFEEDCQEIMGYIEQKGWPKEYSKLVIDAIHERFDSEFDVPKNTLREAVIREINRAPKVFSADEENVKLDPKFVN